MDKLTRQQQKALHLFCQFIADELNNAGLDMKKTLKPEIDIPWCKSSVKEYLWRPIQKAITQKESTTKLAKNKEIDLIAETLMRHLGSQFGIPLEFPSIETLLLNEESKKL